MNYETVVVGAGVAAVVLLAIIAIVGLLVVRRCRNSRQRETIRQNIYLTSFDAPDEVLPESSNTEPVTPVP